MTALFILIVLLGIADVVTTIIAMRRGMTELNPVARPLFRLFGVVSVTLVFKLMFFAAVLALAWIYPYPALLVGIAFLQAAIVAKNLFELS